MQRRAERIHDGRTVPAMKEELKPLQRVGTNLSERNGTAQPLARSSGGSDCCKWSVIACSLGAGKKNEGSQLSQMTTTTME